MPRKARKPIWIVETSELYGNTYRCPASTREEAKDAFRQGRCKKGRRRFVDEEIGFMYPSSSEVGKR